MEKKMKHLIGKSCKLTLDINSKQLFYTAKKVISISDTHISFIDKYNEMISFRMKDVVEVNNVK